MTKYYAITLLIAAFQVWVTSAAWFFFNLIWQATPLAATVFALTIYALPWAIFYLCARGSACSAGR